MNAYAGEWQFSVGIPASCGSSGLMLLVIPKVCGICIYSPRINEYRCHIEEFVLVSCLKKYRVNIFDQLVFGNNPNSLMTDMDDEDTSGKHLEDVDLTVAEKELKEVKCFDFYLRLAVEMLKNLKHYLLRVLMSMSPIT